MPPTRPGSTLSGLALPLFLITLPIIAPALVSGWLLAFTMSLDDLVIASFVSGPGASTLPMVIFSKVRLGVSPDPFLMGVAVAASCAFLTPIGHKNNTLIMGPGGYRFGDYWRMGLPLEVLIIVVSVPSILVVWPL